MFGPQGTVYVYRSYGMHWCVNVVTGPEGTPSAILIRGGDVIQGVETALQRRGRGDHLADGPGKLCQALAIDGSMTASTLNNGPIGLIVALSHPLSFDVTPRIGITRATERLWRYTLPAAR